MIEWNRVTWYSKALAVAVFIGTFVLAFWLGVVWEQVHVETALQSAPSSADAGGAGAHCGGFIQDAPTCAPGFHCVLSVNTPDTGGTCVADASGSGEGILPYDSGVRGTVVLGPTCPVESTSPAGACADKPYSTTVAVFRATDPAHPFALATSSADGSFSVSLPPGNYTLGAGDSALPRCDHPSVVVPATGYATAAISCDTGIR